MPSFPCCPCSRCTGTLIVSGSSGIDQQGTAPALTPLPAPDRAMEVDAHPNAVSAKGQEGNTLTALDDQHGARVFQQKADAPASATGTQQGAASSLPAAPASTGAARMVDTGPAPAHEGPAAPPDSTATPAAGLEPGSPGPLTARQVPLPVVLDLAAVRICALMAAIAQQQAGWAQQQANPYQKQLLLLACTVSLIADNHNARAETM